MARKERGESKVSIRQSCEIEWVVKRMLGKGREGAVFLVCSTTENQRCADVVKVIPLNRTDLPTIQKEIVNQNIAAESKYMLAPHVVDVWICSAMSQKKLMKKLLHDAELPTVPSALFILSDLVRGLNLFAFFKTFAVDPTILRPAWQALYRAIQELHFKVGLIHGDLNPGNVMVEITFEKSSKNKSKIRFIDFSMSQLAKEIKSLPDRVKGFQNDWFDVVNYLFRLPADRKVSKDIEAQYRELWSDIEKWQKSPITQPTLVEWNHWLEMWLGIDKSLGESQTAAYYNFENEGSETF